MKNLMQPALQCHGNEAMELTMYISALSSLPAMSPMKIPASGHIAYAAMPAAVSVRAAEVRGTHSRFVIRKYFGKYPKYHNTSGSVASWHETDRARVCHRYDMILLPTVTADFRYGSIRKIPAIAL